MPNEKKQSTRFHREPAASQGSRDVVVLPNKGGQETRKASTHQRNIDEATRRANNERSHKY